MRSSARFYLFLVVLMLCGPVFAQSGDVTVAFLPGVTVPVGPVIDNDIVAYAIGGGGSLRGEFSPGLARFLFGRAFVDYDLLPLNGSADSVSFVAGGGAFGASFSPSPRIALRASAGGGMYMALLNDIAVRNPFVEGGGEFMVRLGPTLGVGIGAKYKYLFAPDASPYHGISVQLGLSYDLAGSRKGTNIRLDPMLDNVFPLFYTYYDKNPLGMVRLQNDEYIPLEKVKVSFFAKQYMDAPRVSAEFERLPSGGMREVPVYALFNDMIFRVTEGTKTAGEMIVEYYYLGRHTVKTVPVTLDVQNRNAMTWDDDRKAAAFVTAKDPVILGFAKGLASMVRADKNAAAVSLEFRTALGIFQALTAFGVGYAVDPNTPYLATSGNAKAVDFLQFPNQTLAYRAGDCDDLSVLYAALLESVGIATAFVTTPGHIYVAFDTGLTPENASKMFMDPGDLIIREGTVWIPVEITIIKDGFVRAWTVGARQWRDAVATGAEGFYPVREAWDLYSPVGFGEAGLGVTLPSTERLAAAYQSEMDHFSRGQVAPRVAELQEQLKTGKDVEKTANRLGILYAQFGLLNDARAQFNTATRTQEYAPALINLGNVEFLSGQMDKAAQYYSRALKAAPQNAMALVGLARAAQADGDHATFRNTVAVLQTANPDAATRYFPEGSSARASDAENRMVDSWNE